MGMASALAFLDDDKREGAKSHTNETIISKKHLANSKSINTSVVLAIIESHIWLSHTQSSSLINSHSEPVNVMPHQR